MIDFADLWGRNEAGFLQLMRIPSCYDAGSVSEGAPYGRPVREAGRYMQMICTMAGFEIREYEDKVFSASYGSGERIDIASHLDVVEPGDGWQVPPFAALERNDGYVGRGAQDMKSGAWAVYLALRAFKESGIPPRREFRLVYGTDEERTMEDMKAYVKAEGLPSFAFTPDCEFPMYCGEQGAVMWTLSGHYEGRIRSLTGGVQCNVISPSADAVLTNDLDLHRDGRSAHASTPEAGHNATVELLQTLTEMMPEEDVIRRLAVFFRDPYGESAGIAADDPEMGRLTLNLGVLKITEDGELSAQIDVRYPKSVDADAIFARFKEVFPDLSPAMPYNDPPTWTDPGTREVCALRDAYREVTGRECIPTVSGGVSYAKVLGNCVTFGPVPEDHVKLAHQSGEYITKEACEKAVEIYYRSIVKLNEL